MPAPPDLIAFCRHQYPELVGVLGLYCGDRAVAEELAQETLAKVCRDWSRVRKRDNPAGWVRRVAINLANSHYRRGKVERRAMSRLHARTLEASEPDHQDAVALRNAIASLPRRERTAVVLRFYFDMPFWEVGDVMEVPLSTAKTLAGRGVARLRKHSDVPDAKETPGVNTAS